MASAVIRAAVMGDAAQVGELITELGYPTTPEAIALSSSSPPEIENLYRTEARMDASPLWSISAALAINFLTLVLLLLQTRHAGRQTDMLARSLEYSSYLKLLDYLNDVSKLAIEDSEVKKIFGELHFVKDSLAANQNLSIEKIGLAWLVINRYEAAFVGHQLGVLPKGEWEVWQHRLKNDVQLSFVRDVWNEDVKFFAYNQGFRKLMNDLVPPSGEPQAVPAPARPGETPPAAAAPPPPRQE